MHGKSFDSAVINTQESCALLNFSVVCLVGCEEAFYHQFDLLLMDLETCLVKLTWILLRPGFYCT